MSDNGPCHTEDPAVLEDQPGHSPHVGWTPCAFMPPACPGKTRWQPFRHVPVVHFLLELVMSEGEGKRKSLLLISKWESEAQESLLGLQGSTQHTSPQVTATRIRGARGKHKSWGSGSATLTHRERGRAGFTSCVSSKRPPGGSG